MVKKNNPSISSESFEENRKKMVAYSKELALSEKKKNEVAKFLHLVHSTQEELKKVIVGMEAFRETFHTQRNLEERLNLSQRSIVMLMNQLESISPKIYMVEDPVYPILKKTWSFEECQEKLNQFQEYLENP